MLRDSNIVLGITGGIAAYKIPELIRMMTKEGAKVKVVMTDNARQFVTPVTLQTVSENPVYIDTFQMTSRSEIDHIALAEWADIMVIAPATANVIGKIASGIADDLLTTVVTAVKSPVLLCPAMNTNMYTNPVVESNLQKLVSLGYHVMKAASGSLACKTEGPGRLPPLEDILEVIETIFSKKDLRGVRILVTAGPTQEALDPVRFITNHSSGKMGYAIAVMARRRGGDVTLVSGPTLMVPPQGVRFVPIESALQMHQAVMENFDEVDVVVKAAAVSDYRPARFSPSKIKKEKDALCVDLKKNPDIIAEIGKAKGNKIVVGFAMETDDLIENAKKKMTEKCMDLIVANDLSEPGSGFKHDTNIVTLIDRSGAVERLPLMGKGDVADAILDRISALLQN